MKLLIFLIALIVYIIGVLKIKYRLEKFCEKTNLGDIRKKKSIGASRSEKEIIKKYGGLRLYESMKICYEIESFMIVLYGIPVFILSLFGGKSYIFFFMSIAIYMYVRRIFKLKKIIKERKEAFLIVYSDFLDYIKIGITIGLPIMRILKDFMVKRKPTTYYLKVMEKNIKLYSLNFGEEDIFQNILEDLRDREVIVLMNFFNLYNKVGMSSETYLESLSEDALILKRDSIKKRGEEASVKMLFPMTLIFISILALVIGPTIISLNL